MRRNRLHAFAEQCIEPRICNPANFTDSTFGLVKFFVEWDLGLERVPRQQLPFGLCADCGYGLRMDWQQIAALAIVAVTGALFVRARLRRRKAKFPCDSGCGCSGTTPAPGPSVTYHARKGERAEIIVKMWDYAVRKQGLPMKPKDSDLKKSG